MIDLSGEVALVTGGSRGIGRATCRLLAQAGAQVAFGYHQRHGEARRLLEELRTLAGKGLAVPGDLREPESVRRLFQQTRAELGPVDIVVANAGIWERAPIESMTLEQWRKTMEVNLQSVYLTCQEAAREMKPRKRGKIILISSTAGQRGEAFYSHYAASKGAIIALTRSLAAELGPFQIQVNCVAPGWVRTDMTAAVFADESRRRAIEREIPLGRIAEPEDVAGVVLCLASPYMGHVQGAVISVNGGSVLG